jgi:hypothetical protein
MVEGLAMRKMAALVLALTFAGISFSQQTQPEFPNPGVLKHRMEWCKQNWEKCKERKLRRLSVEKECLERSQNHDAFRECMVQFKQQTRQKIKEWKRD